MAGTTPPFDRSANEMNDPQAATVSEETRHKVGRRQLILIGPVFHSGNWLEAVR